MKISAIIRFKQGDLFLALKKLGWTQIELSRRTRANGAAGLSLGLINRIINLHCRPSIDAAYIIQKVLAEAGVFLDIDRAWPETFKGFKRGVGVFVHTKEVDFERLTDIKDQQSLLDSSPLDKVISEEITDSVDAALCTLDAKSHKVMRLRYFKNKTRKEVGIIMGVTPSVISNLENSALRKLRHENRLEILCGQKTYKGVLNTNNPAAALIT